MFSPSALALSIAQKVDVCVLGAGIVGVSTAYWLAKAGKSVVVVDQLPGAGLDTSFANGGQISVSHAEPWANPSAPLKVLRWLAREESPLLFRPKLDPLQWWWLASWFYECLPHRARRNTIDILKLAAFSREKLQEIRASEAFDYEHKARGILHFYRDPKEYDDALSVAELMRSHGCDRRAVSRREILDLEPAFADAARDIVGGTFTPTDESGNAHLFTVELAKACERMGVRFLYGHQIVRLEHDRRGRLISGVEAKVLPTGQYVTVKAWDYVLSLGSFSARMAAPLGIRLNIYPAKGYSVTIPVGDGLHAPSVSLTDDQYKLVYSRLGNRLRVAGTAELNGYGRELNRARCKAILDNVKTVFPKAGNFDGATFWAGLRPTTPSNLPYIGRSAYKNLFLNTGHGTLGWTMGPGSGHRLAGLLVDEGCRS
jgi:D-amino-acid dehydrogenase